jgi:hypothetical protein
MVGADEPLTAPVDPGKDFRSYIANEGGFKGFFGSAVNPILSRAIFNDEYGEYKDAKADYATQKALFDIDVTRRTEEAKLSAVDPEVESLAQMYEDMGNPLKAAQIRAANKIDAIDENPYTLSQGGLRLDSNNNVLALNPKDVPLTTQERNLAARNDLYAREPQDKTSPEWQAWDRERQFFESSVRANQNIGGTLYSGTGSGVVGGDRQEYVDNTSDQAGAAERAKTGVQTSAKMFADAKAGAEEAYTAVQEYDFSLQNANEVLSGLESGKYNTNVARSMMLDYLGLGGVDDGALLAMGTDEAIQKVQGFNGHTTDFEYGQAFNAAFARLRNNSDVNIGVMRDVIKGLENARGNAANAYQSGVYDASNAAQQTVEKRWVERMDGKNKEKYPKAPKIGLEREGRRYMGGDPTDIRNWLEIQQ